MPRFAPEVYFDLKEYLHASLFHNVENVWEALSKIEFYLHEQPLGKIEGIVDKGAILSHPETISIGKRSIVEAGAYIAGPCIIGNDCEIRHGAYVRGNCVIGNKCVIGHTTEIKNSILLNGSKAGHFAYIGDSILGNQTNLGAGTKLANLRLDSKTVYIHFEKEKINSGLRKFGAIIGDGVELGCNCVTNPGTLFGKNSKCYPCLNVSGVVPEKHLVKSEKKNIHVPI